MTTTPPNTIRDLRSLVPNRRLSYAEAKHIANLQADVLRRRLGVTSAELPLGSVERLPRIVVKRRHGLPVSGLTHWHNGRWVVVLNADEPETRQRFSLAHELKHVLDHTTRDRTCWSDRWRSANDKAEGLADQFAAALLMPKRFFKTAWTQQPNAQAVADLFGVSLPAAIVRASYLGLIEPAPRCVRPEATWDHFGATYFRRPNRVEAVA